MSDAFERLARAAEQLHDSARTLEHLARAAATPAGGHSRPLGR